MYPPNEPKCTRLYPPRVSESTLPYAVFHYMRTWPWLKKIYLQRVRFLPFFSAYVLMVPPQAPMFDPGNTPPGELPPWDVAKAYAFSVVIDKMREVTGKSVRSFLNATKAEFIAGQVRSANGQHPTERTVEYVVARCKDPGWFPGKCRAKGGGRPPVYSEYKKNKVAEVAMETLKRKRVAPTPRRVRQKLPGLTRNPVTGNAMDDKTIQKIFKTRCYDEDEDDPWQYLESQSQDVLAEELKPRRLTSAGWILENIPQSHWLKHVGFDPCYKLLPKKQERLEELQVAAMGKKQWMSKGSARKGPNLRAPKTAKTQTGSQVTKVEWTPVFARGRLRIYVCDPAVAAEDDRHPASLADSQNVAKFVRHVLPQILLEMKKAYKWTTLPKTVVHDKASYMVTTAHERLNGTFAKGLRDGGFKSWIGPDLNSSTEWLAKKWGDVYLHETVNSHIHRLLDTDFACPRLHETLAQFAVRVKKVEKYMNSPQFKAKDGGRGLLGLAQDLRKRCQEVVDRSGERIPK